MSAIGTGLLAILFGCAIGILYARFKQREDFDSFVSGWYFIAIGIGVWAFAYAMDALPKPDEYGKVLRHDFNVSITLASFPGTVIGLYLILTPSRVFKDLKRAHFRVPSEPSQHYSKLVIMGITMLVLSLSRLAWVVLTSANSSGAP